MAGSTETDGSTFFRLGGDEEENADEVNDCQEFIVMCLNASGGNRIGGAFYDAQDAILHLVQVWPQTQIFLGLVNFVRTFQRELLVHTYFWVSYCTFFMYVVNRQKAFVIH